MRWAISIALVLVTQPAQACRHYSRWYYPYPQHCYGLAARAPATPAVLPPKRNDDIPLPGLDFVPVDEPDDETRGRILLRAALGGRQ